MSVVQIATGNVFPPPPRMDGEQLPFAVVALSVKQGLNSIALLKSQQTFQQSFQSSVGHPVVLETLLKTLLKTNKAIELRPWLPSEMIRSGNNNELILQLLVKGRGVFFRARSIGTGNCVQLTNNTRKGQRCRSNTRDKDEAAGRSCNTRICDLSSITRKHASPLTRHFSMGAFMEAQFIQSPAHSFCDARLDQSKCALLISKNYPDLTSNMAHEAVKPSSLCSGLNRLAKLMLISSDESK